MCCRNCTHVVERRDEYRDLLRDVLSAERFGLVRVVEDVDRVLGPPSVVPGPLAQSSTTEAPQAARSKVRRTWMHKLTSVVVFESTGTVSASWRPCMGVRSAFTRRTPGTPCASKVMLGRGTKGAWPDAGTNET